MYQPTFPYSGRGVQNEKEELIGTQAIQRVDVIKNNRIVYSSTPGKRRVRFQYSDNASEPGESYYYLRVIQEDGEMAWGSPAWVTYQP